MPLEYNQGAAHMRDLIICMLIGLLNEQNNQDESEACKAYIKVMDAIEKRCGELMKPVKL